MNVGMLKKLLVGVPDSAEVIIPHHDHTYSRVYGAELVKSEKTSGGAYLEHYPEVSTVGKDSSIELTFVIE